MSVWVLESMTRHRWGFPSNLMAPVVRDMGPLPALGWFAWNMPRFERTLAAFGPVRTHLLTTTISLVNGCDYCSVGHGYALELAFLREHGELFPLTERQLAELRGAPVTLIRHRMLDAVRKAGLHADATKLDRVIELTINPDPRPVEQDDLRLIHLVRMISRLNRIAVEAQPAHDGAHSPIHRDEPLRERYHRLRSGSPS